MEVGIIDQPQEKVVNFVLFELLERQDIYTHILQKIFLYLDPKSLKNSKLTCSQWKVFIEKEIWKSVSGKKVLQDKLMSNWKDEDFVKVSNINLSFGVTCAECDKDVMVFCMDDGLVSVYNSSTQDCLYTFTSHEVCFVSIGDNFISLSSINHLIIIRKTTGQIEYHGKNSSLSCWWRMIKDTVVNLNGYGEILILTKDLKTLKWTEQEQNSNIIFHGRWGFCRDGNYLVIADKEEIHLWDLKNGTHTDKRVKCANVFQVEFCKPYVFAESNISDQRSMKIYDIFTGYLIRDIVVDDPFCIQVDQKLLSIVSKFSATVFDLQELTNKKIENDNLWHRMFWANYAYGASIKSKMVVVPVGGRTVDVYDFWPDREYKMTDDTDREESEEKDEDHSVESDQIDENV